MGEAAMLARLEERVAAVRERADRLDTRLDGFPQVYALRADFDSIHERISEGQGRRTAFVATAAVILLLLSVLFGLLESQRVTAGDVSAQIGRESPWLADKPGIEHRLTLLETNNQTLRLQLATAVARVNAIEALDRFFCRTRAKKLAGC